MGIIEVKTVSTFIIVYSPSRTERLSANIKLTLHMALIRSCKVLCLTRLGIRGRHPASEISAPAQQGAPHYWQLSRVHTDQRFVCGFQNSVRVRLHHTLCRQHAQVVKNTRKIFLTLDKAK